jgi:hypothetical protein
MQSARGFREPTLWLQGGAGISFYEVIGSQSIKGLDIRSAQEKQLARPGKQSRGLRLIGTVGGVLPRGDLPVINK